METKLPRPALFYLFSVQMSVIHPFFTHPKKILGVDSQRIISLDLS